MKKKYGLFKVLTVLLLLVVIATYFIKGRSGAISYLALGDVFVNFIQSFYYFFDTALFILAVGGFYGFLNRVPAYKKLVDNIAQKVKGHGELFIFIVTALFAVLTSVTGLVNVLLVFVPFIIAIIMLLGYDKLVAISSTIVSMLVGFIGGIFVTFRDPNSYYGYGATTIEKMTDISDTSLLLPKLILLVLGIALLIFFIKKHIKNVNDKKVKYELNESNEVSVSEVKGDYKNIKTWPIIVMLSVILVILILGYLPWNTLFGIKCFDKFNEWLLGIKIGEFYKRSR